MLILTKGLRQSQEQHYVNQIQFIWIVVAVVAATVIVVAVVVMMTRMMTHTHHHPHHHYIQGRNEIGKRNEEKRKRTREFP